MSISIKTWPLQSLVQKGVSKNQATVRELTARGPFGQQLAD